MRPRARAHTHTHTHTRARTRTHTHARARTQTHTDAHTRTHTHTHAKLPARTAHAYALSHHQPPPPQGFFAANFQSLFGWARPPQSAPRSYAPAPYAAHANALATTLAEHQYAQQYYGVHPSHTAAQQQQQQQLFNKGGGVAAQAQQQPPVELPPAWLRGMSATGDGGIQYLAPGQPRATRGCAWRSRS